MSKQGATPNKPSNSMETLAKILVGILILTVVGLFLYLLNPFANKERPQAVDEGVKPKVSQNHSEQTDYEFYELLPAQQVTGVPAKPIASSVGTSQKPDAVVVQKKPKIEQPAETNTQEKAENSQNSDELPTPNIENEVNTDPALDNKSQLEVQTSKDTAKKAVIENADTGKTYILQINSFDNADDADKRRAEVLMAGVDAQIVKKRLDDDSMIYQVISRQMPNSQMAQQAQKRLQNSGIDSLIVEQRHR